MPWNIFPDSITTAAIRYVIDHYLGQYLDEKITSEQLNVQIFNGEITLNDIRLSVECLNSKLADKQNWPLEFIDGYIKKFHLNVPIRKILSDSSVVEITGLTLTLQPKQREEWAQSVFESMWNSMTSSLNLAEEYAQYEVKPIDSVEYFATVIESFLDRVKVKFIDTVIIIEHVPKASRNGVGLVLNIESITYKDESGNDPPKKEETNLSEEETKKSYLDHSYSSRTTRIEGLTLSTLEFPCTERTTEYRRMDDSDLTEDDEEEQEEERTEETNYESDCSSDYFETSQGNLKECNRNKIKFCKFNKDIEIVFRLKRTKDVNGPKVSIDVNLGTLLVLMSPRQIYVLYELFNGLTSPEDEGNLKRKLHNKPILDEDYQKIEQDIQNQLMFPPAMEKINIPPYGHGWSTAPLDADEDFLPMDSRLDDISVKSVSSCSSVTSSCTECTTSKSTKTKKDQAAEISEFQFNLDSVTFILLHEDILMESFKDNNLLQSSVNQMLQTVGDFFQNMEMFKLDKENCDLKIVHQLLDNSVKLNHLRLLAVSVHLEGDEKTTLSECCINGFLNTNCLQLTECLYETNSTMQHINLINFNTKECNLNLTFNYLERKSKNIMENIKLQVYLNKCDIEFDITIIDRISALLNRQIICKLNNEGNFYKSINGNLNNNQRISLNLNSKLVNFKLRFPKPDFRPLYDMNRIPWWNRNLRSDYLTIQLSNIVFQTVFDNDYTIKCDTFNVDYYENEKFSPVPIAKCEMDMDGLQCKLNVKMVPSSKINLEPAPQQQQQHETMSMSMASLLENCKQPNGPFSAKKVIYQSDTPHFKSKTGQPEQLLIPGEKQEIDEFKKNTIASAKLQFDISLPKVSIQVPSKHFYELIYNRINNDLLLWKSSVPKPKQSQQCHSSYPENDETYNLCRNALNYDNNESDTDDAPTDNFYSIYNNMSNERQINKNESYITLNVNIKEGSICLRTPVRDTTVNSNVIPEQNGEFFMNINGMDFFMVNGYMGNSNLGFLCLQIINGQLYHCDLLPSNNRHFPINMNSKPENYLFPTIYRSNDGLLVDCKKRGGNRDLLTLAIKIESSNDLLKNIIIAAGLNMCTLRHRMCNEPNSWLTQLIDFFNVQDYPISGYKTKELITELYLHFWESSIDYRPLYVPFKCVLSLGTFRISSHFIQEYNASSLRFIAEECELCLSNNNKMEKNFPYDEQIDLLSDYVNVIDLGLFEISLKTTDKKNCLNQPYFDLRISNNIINIRTCADSCKALTQLIKYFANDGDLIGPEDQMFPHFPNSRYNSPKHVLNENELINVDAVSDVNILSKNQQEKLSDLINDALEDIPDETIQVQVPSSSNSHQEFYSYNGAKVYYFPDENQQLQNETTNNLGPHQQFQQVNTDLGNLQLFYQDKYEQENIEDEFCFINEDTGYNVPKHGHAEIKWLTDEPINIIGDYFVKSKEKVDPLNTPKHFPIPSMKYTLCEMTIIWRLYGGNDFIKQSKTSKDVTNVSSDAKVRRFANYNNSGGSGVTFSVKKHEVDFSSSNNSQNSRICRKNWRKIGGINRNHNTLIEFQLNKIRFQYDYYPELLSKASRTVIIVTEFEIRDRLQTSQINKFLCQYTSQARPKQSNANMLMIKSINKRPDPKLKRQEASITISMLPLRFNIDQEALLFLNEFFTELRDTSTDEDTMGAAAVMSSKHNTPVHQPPVLTFADEEDEEKIREQAKKIIDDNLLILLEDKSEKETDSKEFNICKMSSDDDHNEPIYFRKVVFSSDVEIILNYYPHRLDMSFGPIHGLLLGLTQLNYTVLTLKRIHYRHGILGIGKLFTYLLQEWLNDIKRNQLPKLLSGVGPMHSLIQLCVRDLFCLPFEQYKKDGRFLRGLHRGANSFTTSTAMAALELTTRLIHLIQITAETAFDMLTPGPSVRINPKTKGRRKRYNQPKDIREGVTNAYKLVKEGLGETAENILQVASHEHEQKGYSGAVGGVIRQIPPTIIKPIIIASEATNNVLDGMRCQLVPDARNEANEKWRTDDVDTNLL